MGLFEEDIARDMAEPAYAEGWAEAGFEVAVDRMVAQLTYSSHAFIGAFSTGSGTVTSSTAAFQFPMPSWQVLSPQVEPLVRA